MRCGFSRVATLTELPGMYTYPGVPFHRLATLHEAIIEARGEEPVTSTYLEQFARTLGEPFRRPS